MIEKKTVMAVLKKCYDPEMPINIVDLGLIYDIGVRNSKVNIKMTLTSPGCPMQFYIVEDVKKKVSKIGGVKGVDVEIVFDPPWSPDRMSKTAKKKLGVM